MNSPCSRYVFAFSFSNIFSAPPPVPAPSPFIVLLLVCWVGVELDYEVDPSCVATDWGCGCEMLLNYYGLSTLFRLKSSNKVIIFFLKSCPKTLLWYISCESRRQSLGHSSSNRGLAPEKSSTQILQGIQVLCTSQIDRIQSSCFCVRISSAGVLLACSEKLDAKLHRLYKPPSQCCHTPLG